MYDHCIITTEYTTIKHGGGGGRVLSKLLCSTFSLKYPWLQRIFGYNFLNARLLAFLICLTSKYNMVRVIMHTVSIIYSGLFYQQEHKVECKIK